MALQEMAYWRHVGSVTRSGGSTLERYHADVAMQGGLPTGTTLPNGILVATPYWSGPRGGTIDRIAFYNSAATSCMTRIGMYTNAAQTTLYPATTLYTSPEITNASVTILPQSVSITLATDALYWFVIITSGTTVQVQGNADTFPLLGDWATLNRMACVYQYTTSYTTLPSPFPSSAQVRASGFPILAVRYSG